jgi:hypothetical protein
MKAVLIGFGEVGKGIYEAFGKFHEIQVHDPALREFAMPCDYDIMLVAIPWSDNFIKIVKDYQAMFKPKATINFSTVPIGTSRKIGAAHSPIEGRHDRMAEYLLNHIRWIGGADKFVLRFFDKIPIQAFPIHRSEMTEFLKLRSLAAYALAIEFERYSGRICELIGDDHLGVKIYDRNYNSLNENMGLFDLQRYILDPPEGRIGGHCVIPGVKLLNSQFPDPLLARILDVDSEVEVAEWLKDGKTMNDHQGEKK